MMTWHNDDNDGSDDHDANDACEKEKDVIKNNKIKFYENETSNDNDEMVIMTNLMKNADNFEHG